MLARAIADGEPALLLDADMLVCGDLLELAALARRDGIVLSPHTSTPIAHRPGEADLLPQSGGLGREQR